MVPSKHNSRVQGASGTSALTDAQAIDSQGMKLSSLQPITPRLLRKLLGERLSTAGTVVLGLSAPLVEAGQAEVVLAGGL